MKFLELGFYWTEFGYFGFLLLETLLPSVAPWLPGRRVSPRGAPWPCHRREPRCSIAPVADPVQWEVISMSPWVSGEAGWQACGLSGSPLLLCTHLGVPSAFCNFYACFSALVRLSATISGPDFLLSDLSHGLGSRAPASSYGPRVASVNFVSSLPGFGCSPCGRTGLCPGAVNLRGGHGAVSGHLCCGCGLRGPCPTPRVLGGALSSLLV